MSFPVFSHPSSDELLAFAASGTNDGLARHLARCAECRTALFTLATIDNAVKGMAAPALDPSVRERMLASRAEGMRVVLPAGDFDVVKAPARRWMVAAAMIVVAIGAVLGEGVLSSRQEADAGSKEGVMRISPAMPRPGESVTVSYDAPAALVPFKTLVVRARLRTTDAGAYEPGIPVQTVATLVRGKGNAYSARFILPDSVVFAALAVEDSAGTTIDDHGKRTWEILTTLDGRNPAFRALYQRTQDMMGRSFKDGKETARRMTTLYPDSVHGWSYLHSFELWAGTGNVDSVAAEHRAQLRRLDAKWRVAPRVPNAVIGEMAWYSRSVDSATGRYWYDRLMKEAPTNSYALQFRLTESWRKADADHDTLSRIALFDTLWAARSADRAQQIAGTAIDVAIATERPEFIARWSDRLLSVSSDSAGTLMSIGDDMSRHAALRRQAVGILHSALASIESDAKNRYLTETVVARRARADRTRGKVLALLGRTLVAAGETKAGLDTLQLAAKSGWDVATYRTIRSASLAAGDSALAWEMTARLLADPSTTDKVRDSLEAIALGALGTAKWGALRKEGTRVFSQRMLEGSKMQSVPGKPRMRSSDGMEVSLREHSAGKVTVVAFWSRSCGWALDDLDNLNRVADRLEKNGSRFVLMIEDEPGPSPALAAFMKEHNVHVPVFFDVDQSMSRAFNNWGTPDYFVLDDGGRLRFPVVNRATDALVRAEALRQR